MEIAVMKPKPGKDAADKPNEHSWGKGTRRLNVNLDERLHRELKVRAARQNKTMSDIIVQLIKDYVESY